MKARFIIGILVAVFVLFMAVECVDAQETPGGLLLYWAQNPAEQKVEWYVVEVRSGREGAWQSLGNTSYCQTQTDFLGVYPSLQASEVPDSVCSLGMNLADVPVDNATQLGTELCFQVKAARPGALGPASDMTCGTIAPIGAPAPTPVDGIDLTPPGQLTVRFR